MALSKPICYLCKENVSVVAGRCPGCNSLLSRSRFHCISLGSWEQFVAMPKEQRTKFYREKHQLTGDNLKAAIKETISESHSEKEMEAFIKDGKFLDKEDMTKKYEGKPEQLESIFANTKRFHCDVRDVLLYEDPEYTSTKRSSKESSKDSKRGITSERGMKPAKVPKVREENREPETLTKGHIKMLNDHVETLKDLVQKNLQDLLEEAIQLFFQAMDENYAWDPRH